MSTVEAPRMGAIGRARASVAAVETLAAIRREARTVATDDEQEVLAGWSGWGPLHKAFAPTDDTWAGLAERVNAVLPPGDVELGMQGTYNAFFTPEPIARAMWRILGALGFAGGHVLEPGCGGGIFMRTAPDGVAMTGVERDPTSAQICRLLNPQHRVIEGKFQDTRMAGARFAAAIGNVPFGDVKVFDPVAPNGVCHSLHDYFIWRTVDLLDAGGIAVLLTSRYTMDKAVPDARELIGKQADLVRAFRLPNGALGGGTDVVADVLVLRKRTGVPANGYRWDATERDTYGWKNPVNVYWAGSPLAVLGQMTSGGTSQYGLTLEVKPRPGDPEPAQWLNEAADTMTVEADARGLLWQAPVDVAAPPDTDGLVSEQGWHNGSFRLVGDDLVRVENGRLTPLERPSKELRALVGLRDAAVKLVEMEADHSIGDRILDPLRADLGLLYADYVSTFGPLNRCTLVEGKPDEETGLPTYTRRTPTMGGFRQDPEAGIVFALEVYDDETGMAGPAPILATRQNLPVVQPTSTDDPAQALAWSLNYQAGRVDIGYIAALLRCSRLEVPGLLGEAVYQDPATREWMTVEQYCSGNVRAKLTVARKAAAVLPEFTRNVAVLEKAQPPWMGPGEIGVNLGSPWIGAADVTAFVVETLGSRGAAVKRIASTGQWEVEVPGHLRDSVAATADWGTYDIDAYQLVALALNGKTPVVHRTVTIRGEQVKRKDPDASILASQKQQALKERFTEWLWEDPDRTERLVNYYNTHHNCLVARQFCGEHITVDGLAPWFQPYKHQKEFVARAVSTPASLCGHPVGAGKTATMAMTLMKLRQLGLVRKPMVVVPNHLKDQIEREFRQLFPGAKILAAASETIAKDRRAFNAKVATQDWDIVLVTHSAFDRMGVCPQTEAAYLRIELDELEDAIVSACPEGKLTGRAVKNLAKRRDGLEEKLDELTTRARGFDLGLTFESMGVDFIALDEAHYYKNLAVPVRTDGFSVRPSKRATALEIKLRWLAQRGGGRYAALFTGTPVSNTMLELYVLLRYLMFAELREMDMGNADSWCQMFVQMAASVDVTVDGGQFQMVTRPALFINAPELRMLLSQCADIRTAKQLGLKRPATILETVVCQPTRAQAAYSSELVARAEHVKSRGFRFDDGDRDNMLAICGDGRRMATDPALVGIHDDEPGKLDQVADNMIRIWKEDKDCLQIGFCDVGTPNDRKGSQTYGRLRRKLIDRGMPAGLIRFVHDANGDGDKAQLFADCRASGKVAVILGSTDKLGVGTNIQRRGKAMHHIDAPFRPADVEQRDGRFERPGNRYDTVLIFRYVTARTFDAYTWQLLTRKIGFISQVMSGNLDRTVEDISADVVDTYAAVKAAAADQPLLMEKAKTESEIKRLRGLQRGHRSTVDRLHRDITRRRDQIATAQAQAASWEAITAATGHPVTPLEGLSEEQAEALHAMAKRAGYWQPPQTFAGVQVTVGRWYTQGDRPESHPLLHLRAETDTSPVELRAYAFWTAHRLAGALISLLHKASVNSSELREKIQRWETENERAQLSAQRPFEHAEALTALTARLDQIEAELHAAALRNEEDKDAPAEALEAARQEQASRRQAQQQAALVQHTPSAEAGGQRGPTPQPVLEDDPADGGADLDELLGEWMDEYDPQTVEFLADLMA